MSSERNWPKLHLSTALILLLVAGGLLWANLTPRFEIIEVPATDAMLVSPYEHGRIVTIVEYGWPCDVVVSWLDSLDPKVVLRPEGFLWSRIIANVVAALMILLVLAYVLERTWITTGITRTHFCQK